MMPFLAAVVLVSQAVPTAYDEGVQARKLGNLDQAVELLARAVSDEPQNADAWLMYGLALRDVGRAEDARRALKRALELAPDYGDAKDALANLEGGIPRRARVTVATSYTAVAKAGDWHQLTLLTSIPVGSSSVTTATLEENDRFGRSDTYLEGRLDTRLSRGSSAYGFFGATIDADFRPSWQVGVGAEAPVLTGRLPISATLEAVRAQYEDVVWTVSPGLQSYVAKGRAWVTAKWINVLSEGVHDVGAYGRVDFQVQPSLRIFAGLARAPDLSEGEVLKTRSVFGGLVAGLTQNLEGRLSVGRDLPSGSLKRTTISASLSVPLK